MGLILFLILGTLMAFDTRNLEPFIPEAWYIGIILGLYWDYIGMENKMETTRDYKDYIGMILGL